MLKRLKAWARELKFDLIALWYCQSHPDTPLLAKGLTIFVVGYAFSPIDLIPDFIPVLGYLDDLIIVPAGIYLAIRLIPPHVLAEGRTFARDWEAQQKGRPPNWIAAALIVFAWLGLAWTGWCFIQR